MIKTAHFILIGFLLTASSFCGKKEEAAKPEKIPVVRGVIGEIVTAATVDSYYEAVGTVRAKTSSILSSKVMGHVVALHVREGEQVKAGQLLVEIDDRDGNAQLRKAQAALREARDATEEMNRHIQAAESAKLAAEAEQVLSLSTFNRYKSLLEKKSVSRQEFDQAEARYRAKTAELERAQAQIQSLRARKEQGGARIEQAEAEVAAARLSVGYARIHSPLKGVVASKQIEIGVLAVPGAPLLTIEDNAHYRLEAAVEESVLGKIRLGNPVGITIEAIGPEEWGGKVAEISPGSDPASRSGIVKIDFLPKAKKEGPLRALRSGLFGKARFSAGQRTLIAVPAKAVVHHGQLEGVFVADSANMARFRLIQTGKTYGERVEVLSGLREGEKILVAGLEKVQDGCRVEW